MFVNNVSRKKSGAVSGISNEESEAKNTLQGAEPVVKSNYIFTICGMQF